MDVSTVEAVRILLVERFKVLGVSSGIEGDADSV